MSTTRSILGASALAISLLSLPRAASAAPPTKEECVDAHGKGQDARESGQLGRAAKLFLTCAQSTCPDLVRSDCARFVDELDRLQPTVTFVARDGARRDLPDTSVYVDGTLVASSLGDGKPRDLDPGRHEVRFVHGADETTVTVVIAQGEKGRAIVGTFAPATPATPAAPTASPAPAAPAPADTAPKLERSSTPLVVLGFGAAAMAAGGALLGLGFARMPASCSLSTHTCAAPPSDPVFGKASGSVSLINAGAIAGGAGTAVLAGSLIWYFTQPLRPAKGTTTAITPWFGPQGAGLSAFKAF